jgi:hypothetical protein
MGCRNLTDAASPPRRGESDSDKDKDKDKDKDMLSNWRDPPRPSEKSPEQGRPYNRRNREVGQRREGVGRASSSEEAE